MLAALTQALEERDAYSRGHTLRVTDLAGELARGLGIPEPARVLSVAAAFDAMTSSRPYRAALTADAALAELERCTGSQFDPTVARAFAEAWVAGEVPFAAESPAA